MVFFHQIFQLSCFCFRFRYFTFVGWLLASWHQLLRSGKLGFHTSKQMFYGFALSADLLIFALLPPPDMAHLIELSLPLRSDAKSFFNVGFWLHQYLSLPSGNFLPISFIASPTSMAAKVGAINTVDKQNRKKERLRIFFIRNSLEEFFSMHLQLQYKD